MITQEQIERRREIARNYRARNLEKCRLREKLLKRSKPKTYRIWANMKQRCHNPSNWAYKYYGARGIVVCERWHAYKNFAADVGEPEKGMTLDRIDNNGNYCPDNVRWTSRLVQSRNRSDSWLTQHIAQWIWYMRYDLRWRVQDIASFFGKPVSTVGNCLYSKTWNPPQKRIGRVAA